MVPVVPCSLLLLTQTAILLSSSFFLCLDSCKCGAGALQGKTTNTTARTFVAQTRLTPPQQVFSMKFVLA